jgi:hypothetical protein
MLRTGSGYFYHFLKEFFRCKNVQISHQIVVDTVHTELNHSHEGKVSLLTHVSSVEKVQYLTGCP